ncbi:hypothetical protein N9Y92_01990 [Chlamydiales bacterium]|nr:hypothetical protein [Chlamydiales bacterium]
MSEGTQATQIGLHSVRNLLGEEKQLSLFSEHDKEFSKNFNVQVDSDIDRFGIDLTDLESQIMEAILGEFSRTNYEGNIDGENVEDVAEKYSGSLPETYKYLSKVPKIRVNQNEILNQAGVNRASVGERVRAIEAINRLGTKQFCFYYDRLAFNKSGQPEKNKDGSWRKEEVYAVDTIFKIKKVIDDRTKVLKYLEVTPSPIFLDQRENYFMFVPYNWREEVKGLVGEKKASSFTFRFLYFLRYQYELKRRSKSQNPPYVIKWSPEEVAGAIKMSKTTIVRNKKRMHSTLQEVYEVGKRLGYLNSYKRTSYTDELVLCDEKYIWTNRRQSLSINVLDSEKQETEKPAKYLFSLFHEIRSKVCPEEYEHPNIKEEVRQIGVFRTLLGEKTPENIETLIKWISKNGYWLSKCSKPDDLIKNFQDIWFEMEAKSMGSKGKREDKNKVLAKQLLKEFNGKTSSSGFRVDILSKYVEFVSGPHADYVTYDDSDFENKVKSRMVKYSFDVF